MALDEPSDFSDFEIAHSYFSGSLKVREIAKRANKSIGEVYRIIHKNGRPNRQITNHNNVMWFSENPMMRVKDIASFTGYTPRNIRYILKNKLTEGKNGT